MEYQKAEVDDSRQVVSRVTKSAPRTAVEDGPEGITDLGSRHQFLQMHAPGGAGLHRRGQGNLADAAGQRFRRPGPPCHDAGSPRRLSASVAALATASTGDAGSAVHPHRTRPHAETTRRRASVPRPPRQPAFTARRADQTSGRPAGPAPAGTPGVASARQHPNLEPLSSRGSVNLVVSAGRLPGRLGISNSR